MALTEAEKQKLKVQLQELNDSLRVKCMEVVKSLSLEDIKNQQIPLQGHDKVQISDILPEVHKNQQMTPAVHFKYVE